MFGSEPLCKCGVWPAQVSFLFSWVSHKGLVRNTNKQQHTNRPLNTAIFTERERERERDRDRDRDRQTDRQTDRPTDRQRQRQRDRQTDRQKDREREVVYGNTIAVLE